MYFAGWHSRARTFRSRFYKLDLYHDQAVQFDTSLNDFYLLKLTG